MVWYRKHPIQSVHSCTLVVFFVRTTNGMIINLTHMMRQKLTSTRVPASTDTCHWHRCLFRFTFIKILMKWSLPNFAHGMTQLWCHGLCNKFFHTGVCSSGVRTLALYPGVGSHVMLVSTYVPTKMGPFFRPRYPFGWILKVLGIH